MELWSLTHANSDSFEVGLSRNGDRTQLAGDRGEHLDIQKAKASFVEAADQFIEGEFRGIAFSVEHGFAGKKAACRHAVDSSNQFISSPDFDAVSMPALVQFRICVDEIQGNPIAVLAPFGATEHDVIESPVSGDGIRMLP